MSLGGGTGPGPVVPGPDEARPRSRGLVVAACVLVCVAAASRFAVYLPLLVLGSSTGIDDAVLVLELLAGSVLVMLVAHAVAGGLVISWLWRAWANAAARAPQRWSQGWVAGAWFVPVLNLWVPAVIVTDIARASLGADDPARERIRAAVAFWWAGWVGAGAALTVAMSGYPVLGIGASGPGNLGTWFALFAGASALLSVLAAAAFSFLALQIGARQDAAAPPPPDTPLPDAAAAADGPSATDPVPAAPGPPAPVAAGRRTPAWLLPAIAGGVVVLLLGTGVALVAAGDDPPAEVVAAAVEDAREWSGANYRGTAPVPGGPPVEFDITVTTAGAQGTLTRGGGRAEVVQDGTGVLVKGNREWWAHRYPERAEQLAGRWLSDADTETTAIDHILRLDPTGLEDQVHPDLGPLWERTGERVVDGQPAIVLSSGLVVLVVTAEEPYRLLSIEFEAFGGPQSEPVRITVVDPARAGEVDGVVARVRAESPRSVAQQLVLRPQADIQIRPESFCTSPTCTATFTVTNTGEIAITGVFEMTADGTPAGTGRLDLQPGESATFHGSAPNRLYNSPGARGQIYWTGRVVPY